MYKDNVDCRYSRDPGNGCLPCFWSWLCTRLWRRFWTPCLQWCAPLHGWPCTSLHVHLVSGSFFRILLNVMINCTWHTDIGLFTNYCAQGNIRPNFIFIPFALVNGQISMSLNISLKTQQLLLCEFKTVYSNFNWKISSVTCRVQKYTLTLFKWMFCFFFIRITE